MSPTFNNGQIDGEISICAHYVQYRFWPWPDGFEPDDETLEQLEEAAEERAKDCIIQGYIEGQLCASVPSDDGDELELHGWWMINRDR